MGTCNMEHVHAKRLQAVSCRFSVLSEDVAQMVCFFGGGGGHSMIKEEVPTK